MSKKVIKKLRFRNRSLGLREDLYEMDFPAYDLRPVPVTKEMVEAIGAAPRAACMGRDLLCVFDDPSVVENLAPDLDVKREIKVHQLRGLRVHHSLVELL